MKFSKIALLSVGLLNVISILGDWAWRKETRRAYRGPGADYCHSRWCERKYGYAPDRYRRTDWRARRGGDYEMERREYGPGKEEVTKKSAKVQRSFWTGEPQGMVKTETKEIKY